MEVKKITTFTKLGPVTTLFCLHPLLKIDRSTSYDALQIQNTASGFVRLKKR